RSLGAARPAALASAEPVRHRHAERVCDLRHFAVEPCELGIEEHHQAHRFLCNNSSRSTAAEEHCDLAEDVTWTERADQISVDQDVSRSVHDGEHCVPEVTLFREL